MRHSEALSAMLEERPSASGSALLEERFTRGAAFSLEGASDREGGRDEMISFMPGLARGEGRKMNQMEDRSGRESRAGLKLAKKFDIKYALDATASVLSKGI